MKQYFLQQNGSASLLLFFAGWGMDKHPFVSDEPFPSDCLLCYDYTCPEFDYSLLNGYTSIRLSAWSMGVWHASAVFADYTDIPISDSIALNGTLFPVDERRGIAPAIAHGTCAGLTDSSLDKFRRRMCGSPSEYTTFLNRIPHRSVQDLQSELASIITRSSAQPTPRFAWHKAYIGQNDRIFPPTSQQAAWDEQGVQTLVHPIAHYSHDFIHHLLHTDTWTND